MHRSGVRRGWPLRGGERSEGRCATGWVFRERSERISERSEHHSRNPSVGRRLTDGLLRRLKASRSPHSATAAKSAADSQSRSATGVATIRQNCATAAKRSGHDQANL
jgi:hypothetical protein